MSLSSLSLDAFYACAQVGHFTQAASELGITQSALSQRIARLEEELGTSLFVRDPSGIQLTPAGQELMRYCQLRQQLEQESVQSIRGLEEKGLSGVVRIGGFSSIIRSAVMPALKSLLSENPQLRLQVFTREMDELPGMLKSGEVDYMIHYGEVVRREFESEPLGVERNVLVEKPGYKGPDIFLDHDENDQTTVKYLKKAGFKKEFQRRYLDDVYGLIDGVKLGWGRAVIPQHLIKNEKGVKVVKQSTHLDFPVRLHYLKQPFYSRLHQELMEALQNGVPFFLKGS